MSDIVKHSPKAFLERPEGKLGLAITAVAAVAGLYGLYLALPVMIALATDVLHLAALSAAIGVIAYCVLDRRVRSLMSYLYRAFWRWVTGRIIELDPIGILRGHIRDLHEKLANVREQMGLLNGQIKSIEHTIQENAQMRDTAWQLARAGGTNPEYANASRLQARHAVRLDESNENLSTIQRQMLVLSGMLKKIHDAAESVLTDMQSTVDIKERERASIKAAYSAYRSAFAILQGESEGRELYDGAMEYLNQDYAKKLGEIEMFIDFSDGIIKATDLQGRRLTFGHALGRNAAKIITNMTCCVFGMGYILAGITEQKQALHDMIASTLVLRK